MGFRACRVGSGSPYGLRAGVAVAMVLGGFRAGLG